MAFGSARRTYSRKPERADARAPAGSGSRSGRSSSARTPRCMSAPRTVPRATPRMPSDGLSTTGADDDAQVVEHRRQPVGEEALAHDEHLAERERRREDDRGHAHDPEELGVLGPLLLVEAGRDESRPSTARSRRAPRRSTIIRSTRHGQDRAREVLRWRRRPRCAGARRPARTRTRGQRRRGCSSASSGRTSAAL